MHVVDSSFLDAKKTGVESEIQYVVFPFGLTSV